MNIEEAKKRRDMRVAWWKARKARKPDGQIIQPYNNSTPKSLVSICPYFKRTCCGEPNLCGLDGGECQTPKESCNKMPQGLTTS